MSKMLTMDAAAARLNASVDEVLDLAVNGVLKVCAALPSHKDAGRGELTFCTEDGAQFVGVTNGFYQGLTRRDFQTLQSNGRLFLDGRPGELPNEGGDPIRVILGPDGPCIGVIDLRVSERELQRFIDSIPSAKVQDGGGAERMAGWRRVLRDNLAEIIRIHRSLGARGSLARTALRWVKKNGPRDTIPLVQPDDDSLAWIGEDCSPRAVTLKTIRNTFGEWRKDGLIPDGL